MTEAQVADAVAFAMSTSFAGFRAQIITEDGSQISEGDTFTVSDGSMTVAFEFDSGYSIQTPAFVGAITDGETFFINDGQGGTSRSM